MILQLMALAVGFYCQLHFLLTCLRLYLFPVAFGVSQ